MSERFSKEQISWFKKAFSYVVNSTVINIKDCSTVLRLLGHKPTDAELDQMFHREDTSGTGTINFQNFLHLMSMLENGLEVQRQGEMSPSAFLEGKTLQLLGFPDHQQKNLSEWVLQAKGDLVFPGFQGSLDYLVVPYRGWQVQPVEYSNLVSEMWLEDCLDAWNLLVPSYHHHPILVPQGCTVLTGVVATLSGFIGREREYLGSLITELGGKHQDGFAKEDIKDYNVMRNTHLIYLTMTENVEKIKAAMKWKRPVVTEYWLLACLRDLALVSEHRFLVEGCNTVTDNRPQEVEDHIHVEEVVFIKEVSKTTTVGTQTSTAIPEVKITMPECPICFEKLKPPMRIVQCLKGHKLCEPCTQKEKVVACPLNCKSGFIGRDYGMEAFMEQLAQNSGRKH